MRVHLLLTNVIDCNRFYIDEMSSSFFIIKSFPQYGPNMNLFQVKRVIIVLPLTRRSILRLQRHLKGNTFLGRLRCHSTKYM